jgi:predicted secreted protein
MKWTSIVAIYALFWVMSAFLVMPFGVRTPEEAGVEKIPGQSESAPANFNPKRILLRTTLLALALFALFYANYLYGWIKAEDLNFFGKPPNYDGTRN